MRSDQRARARARGCILLADLLGGVLTPRVLEASALDERVARALRELGWEPGHEGPLPEELQAVHYEAFGRAVPPLAGVFLDPAARGGGQAEVLWSEAVERLELPELPPTGEPPEHLASQLRVLAASLDAEARALEASPAAEVGGLRDVQVELLDEHLLRWMPAFCSATKDLNLELPNAVVSLLEEILVGLRAELPAGRQLPWTLAGEAPLLDDAQTGLKALSEWLGTPSRCGLLLSTATLEHIGRELDLPRGFGSRGRILEGLLRAGARFGSSDRLVQALEEQVEGHEARLAALREQTPRLDPALKPWTSRLQETREQLATVRRLLASHAEARSEPTPGPGEP